MFTFTFAVLLASIHIFAKNMRFIQIIPRSRFLSLGGGVSVAYVFIHILPELKEHQESIEDTGVMLSYLEHHVYLLAMLGLVIFYVLERVAKESQKKNRRDAGTNQPKKGTFWLHITSFFLYNSLIGYLLIHRDSGGWGIGVITEMPEAALALLFAFISGGIILMY